MWYCNERHGCETRKQGLRILTIIDTKADTAAPACIVQEGHEGVDITFTCIASDDFSALNDTETLEMRGLLVKDAEEPVVRLRRDP